jgi:type VI protein secretion system component Hcp
MKTTTKESNETKRQAKKAKQPQRKFPDLAVKKDVHGGDFVFTKKIDKGSPTLLP